MDIDIDSREIEKRKQNITRVWEHKTVDHIPISVWMDDFSTCTLREQCEDGRLQFDVMVKNMKRCLKCLPDDYIPYVRIWPGYMTIATMFGMEMYWSDDPNQAPGADGYVIDDMNQIYNLAMPDPVNDGLMPHNLRWLDYANRHLPKDVHITGIDLGGPLNTAKDLIETNLMYTALIDAPQAMNYFLTMVTQLQIRCNQEIIKAAGGLERLTCTDFDPIWAPLMYKGFVSDDVCASLSPTMFEEFSIPYNNRIVNGFNGARIHNCGPNPSAHLYPEHAVDVMGLNCSFKYSKDDLYMLKEAFGGRGFIEFNFDNEETPEEIIAGYEQIANTLSPDTVALPLLFLNETWSDDDIRAVYTDLRNISERYAAEIRWREDG